MIADLRVRVALGVISLALLAGGSAWLAFRGAADARDLVEALPPGEGPVVYIDVAQLRRTGILDHLAGAPAAEEPAYRSFVEATGFDYRRHLDAVAVAFLPQGNFFVLRGRFSFDRLSKYAQVSGGTCRDGVCSLVGSARDRQISFRLLGGQTLALAVSPSDVYAVLAVKAANRSTPVMGGVAWMQLPQSSLRPRMGLPVPVNVNLAALQRAREAFLRLEVSATETALKLEALCQDAEAAGEVSGRLKGGEFQVEGSRVRGRWRLPADWLKALTT